MKLHEADCNYPPDKSVNIINYRFIQTLAGVVVY